MSATANTPAAQYSQNGQPCSAPHFYAVACNPHQPVVVEACAGAGKTWLLVSRIARALLMGTPPHEILAITFTKKASAEMAQRLTQLLSSWRQLDEAALAAELVARGLSASESQRSETLERARQLYGVSLSGRGVQIRTFHGWFASLLRMAPMSLLQSLALPSPYELLEDDAEAIAHVWPRFYAQVKNDPDLYKDFEAAMADCGRHNLVEALSFSLSKRIEFELADSQAHANGHGLEEAVADFRIVFPAFANCADLANPFNDTPLFKGCIQAAASALGAMTRNKAATKAAARLGPAIETNDLNTIQDVFLTKKGTPRVTGLAADDPAVVRAAQDWLIDWCGAKHQQACALHQRRMVRLSRVLLDCFKAFKRQRGWVDMNDIESAATQLLADSALSAWVQQRLDAQIRHLLIDEFQDTNPMQWRALRAWLEGYAGAGGGGGEAPSVFIVGDPKQSIYRFRRAEPRVFRAATDFLRDALGATVLACDHTRRNSQSIIDTLNSVMSATESNDPDAPVFRRHSTQRDAAGRFLTLPMVDRETEDSTDPDEGGEAVTAAWRDSLDTPKLEKQERQAVSEAKQAAQWIKSQLDAGALVPADVMVIARTNARLGVMQRALAAVGVPCAQPEKSSLIESQAVADVIALLDALVSPGHDLSMAQAIRSPLFNGTDADLVAIAEHILKTGDKASGAWLRALDELAGLDMGDIPMRPIQSRAKEWMASVARMRVFLRTQSLHEALVSIYQERRVFAAYAAAVPDTMRAATLAQLAALLDESLMVNQGRFLTPYQFIRAIKAGTRRHAWPTPPEVVRLLTVHGAKGLEAKVVVLLDTHAPPQRAQSMTVLVDWPATDLAPRRFVFVAKETAPPRCTRDLLGRDQQARGTEENNALYVAMTRAEDCLVLSAHQPRSKDHESWFTRLSPYAECVGPVESWGVDPATEAAADTPTGAAIDLLALPAWRGRQNPPQPAAIDDTATRLGQALHSLLASCFAADTRPNWTVEHLLAVRRQWQLTAEQMAHVVSQATAVRDGEGAWLWSSAAVAFEANEVALFESGELLRLDRLVKTKSGEWWVVDFKSTANPEAAPALCAQLGRYGNAVKKLVGAPDVKLAFLTPKGRLVPLDAQDN